jgi:hypothetical protein
MPGVPTVPTMPGADERPRDPMQPQPPEQPAIPQDALGQAGGRGTLGDVAGTPPIFGDLIGFQGSRIVVLSSNATSPVTSHTAIVSGNRAIVVAPVPYRGAFKITENESPRPTTRVYFNYNYFNNVDNTIVSSGTSIGHADLHRETIGFEYAFMDGDASVGLRLPLIQLTGNSGIEDSQPGDLTAIVKYALLNDHDTGNLFSVGLVLTLPTAPGVAVQGQSVINPYVFQPFVGGIYNPSRDFFIQGFSSIIIPTDERDVTVWFNSIQVGYWIYRDCDKCATIKGIIPVAEVHVSTPFNHRGTDHADPLFYQDTVNITGGAHMVFQRCDAGLAVGIPLTGVKPYDVEVNASLNFRF